VRKIRKSQEKLKNMTEVREKMGVFEKIQEI